MGNNKVTLKIMADGTEREYRCKGAVAFIFDDASASAVSAVKGYGCGEVIALAAYGLIAFARGAAEEVGCDGHEGLKIIKDICEEETRQ